MTDITAAIRESIEKAIPDAVVDVSGAGGHFTIQVVSTVFEGKNRVQSQRLVYSAIAHLMKGDTAPVHAVDKLTTLVP
jgi:acid stress-induced BolA-like protein IbaG/YrbA